MDPATMATTAVAALSPYLVAAGMKTALACGSIVVKRVRIDPNPKKVAPAELAASGELRVGARMT